MTVNLKQEIGLRVKAAGKLRGMTQADLAGAINMSFESVSNLERGKTGASIGTLGNMADALNVDLKYFFDFSPNNLSARRSRLLSDLTATTLEVDDDKLEFFTDLAKVVAQR